MKSDENDNQCVVEALNIDYHKELFKPANLKHRKWLDLSMEGVEIGVGYVGEDDSWLENPRWSQVYQHKDEDFIYSGNTKEFGRVLIMRSLLDCIDIDAVFNELHLHIRNGPKWCADLAFYDIIQCIGPNADIVMGISQPLLGGLIYSRDYVDARYLRKSKTGDCYTWAQRSIKWREGPKEDRVRANGILSWVRLRRLPQLKKTEVVWISKFELNGNIPSFLNDRVTRQVMINFTQQFRSWLRKIGVMK